MMATTQKSGNSNCRCRLWVPNAAKGQTIRPKVSSLEL